jgi:SAM-dependent methyltransferase
MSEYDKNFFNKQKDRSFKSASIIAPEIIQIFNPKSVVDIGCGMGGWLKAFEQNGLSNILGVDGDYVDTNELFIDKKNFIKHDLNTPLKLKKFDIALCLEVAEHLEFLSSDILIETLVSASDNIIFSAAIPGQTGTNHINEQPHSFWSEKFISYGYIVSDYLRLKFMEDKRIPFWYRQNLLIFTKNKNNKLTMQGEVNFSVPNWDKEDPIE